MYDLSESFARRSKDNVNRSTMAKSKNIKVNYTSLGREKALGIADLDTREIFIDSRVRGKQKLYMLIHESNHILHPDWTEEQVISYSRQMTAVLWAEHIRFVDNSTVRNLHQQV